MNEYEAAQRRVTSIVAASEPPQAVFEAVTREASTLLDGAPVALTKFEGQGSDSVVLAQTGDHVHVGARLHLTGDGIAARLWDSGRPERIDDYPSLSPRTMATDLGVRAAVAVPVTVDGNLWGALSVSSKTDPLPPGTEDRLASFVGIVAAAVVSAAARASFHALADEQAALLRVAALVAHRAGEVEIFEAVATEAARLIHDEPTTLARYEGDRTFTILAHRNGPAPVGTRVTVPIGDAGTLDEMMRTLKPARLDRYDLYADRTYSRRDFGVGSSVSVPIIVNGRLSERLPSDVEVTAYFVVAEALANVAKHAQATRAWVTVAGTEDTLVVEVTDDGVGGADPRGGSGLTGLSDRVDALDGALTLTSAQGAGTTVRITLPVPGLRPG